MVVRPDGSIVTIEPQTPTPDQLAPPQEANAGVPKPPSRPAATPERLSATGPNSSVNPVQPVRGAPLALNPQPVRRQPQTTERTPEAAQNTTIARATPTQRLAPAPATAAPTAPGTSSGPVEYVVQLAARRNEQQAVDAYNAFKAKYGNLVGRYKRLIQRADLGASGIYYRVRVGPMGSEATATDLCNKLKAAGLSDCLVRRR